MERIMDQRHGEYEYASFSTPDGMRAEYRKTEMVTGRVVNRQRFTGETAHTDAERAMMDALMEAIYR